MTSRQKPVLAAVSKDTFVTWEMKQLYHAAKKRGFNWVVLDPRHTTFDVTQKTLFTRTIIRSQPEGIFGRIDMDCLTEGGRLLQLLEFAGLPILNNATSFYTGRDKAKTALALQAASLPHPRTWLVARKHISRLAQKLQFPLVAKPVTGSGGEGVTLVETPRILAALPQKMFPLVLQSYCGPVRKELRVVVLQGKVLGSVARYPQNGEWRGNARLGATVVKTSVDDYIKSLAVKATAAIGADFAGVDLIETDQSVFVIEVNVCPGFQAFSRVTGIDVAKQLVMSLASMTKPKAARGEPV